MFNQSQEPVLFDNDLIEIRRTRFGIMAYLRHDHYVGQALAQYGEYSYAEYQLFSQLIKPGQLVVDVGANMGAHTLALAQLVGLQGRVLAFEPQPVVAELLGMNILLNQATQVVPYASPLCDQQQKMYLPKLDYTKPFNFGDVSCSLEPTDVVVFGTRLDDYELPACHFVKIDVQGAEVSVLLGAQQTLAQYRPLLYVENDQLERSSQLIETLLSLDYRLYWHFPPLFNPNNYFAKSENLYPNIVSMNMLGVPNEITLNSDLLPVTDAQDNFRLAIERLARMRAAGE